VAIYSKKEPSQIITNLGWAPADSEGRYLEAQFGALSIISLYLPSGSSSEERQLIKFEFLERFMPLLNEFSNNGRHYIICGDWNIAHKEIDLKNWRGNKKNSGFLPEERAWMDQLIEKNLWNDTFRTLNPNPEQYTWWSNRGQSWSKNVGWRIDYQLSSPNLKGKAQTASIYKDERFSDHAPLIIDYALDL
jgi:exodeoxyribonuclease-3